MINFAVGALIMLLMVLVVTGAIWWLVKIYEYLSGEIGPKRPMPELFAAVAELIRAREGWRSSSENSLSHSSGLRVEWGRYNHLITIHPPQGGRFQEGYRRLRGGEELVTACELLRGILALQSLDEAKKKQKLTDNRRN